MKFLFEFSDECVRLEANCALHDMLTSITVEIKRIYESLDEESREVFKGGIEHMVETGLCFMKDEEIEAKTNEMIRDLLGKGKVN